MHCWHDQPHGVSRGLFAIASVRSAHQTLVITLIRRALAHHVGASRMIVAAIAAATVVRAGLAGTGNLYLGGATAFAAVTVAGSVAEAAVGAGAAAAVCASGESTGTEWHFRSGNKGLPLLTVLQTFFSFGGSAKAGAARSVAERVASIRQRIGSSPKASCQ